MNLDLDSLNAQWVGQRGADQPIRLMGFRGGLEPIGGANNVGISYDDLIIRIIDQQVTFWRASVDPSRYLIAHPVNEDGAAQLCDGIHFFERHLMHAGTPREHWCLGQAEDVHVNRLDKNGFCIDVEFGQFGICIHSGGSVESDTQHFSAGCQILFNPDGYFCDPTWTKFWGPIDAWLQSPDNKDPIVPYMLQDATGLAVQQLAKAA